MSRQADTVSARGGCVEAELKLSANSVQREVQQRGRANAGMHDRRHYELAAGVGQSSSALVVRIEVVVRSITMGRARFGPDRGSGKAKDGQRRTRLFG